MSVKYSEKELIDGCLAEDRKVQRYVYERYYSDFLKVCLRYCDNTPDAKHLLNDSFFKIFTKVSQYSGAGSFEGWMRKTVVNVCLDHVRVRARNLKNVVQVEKESLENLSGHDDNSVFGKMGFDHLLKLIQELPEMSRAVFNLFVFENLSHKEIAEVLGMKEGTSSWYLNKARVEIQRKIQNPVNR